jgi:hypothetical protein
MVNATDVDALEGYFEHMKHGGEIPALIAPSRAGGRAARAAGDVALVGEDLELGDREHHVARRSPAGETARCRPIAGSRQTAVLRLEAGAKRC